VLIDIQLPPNGADIIWDSMSGWGVLGRGNTLLAALALIHVFATSFFGKVIDGQMVSSWSGSCQCVLNDDDNKTWSADTMVYMFLHVNQTFKFVKQIRNTVVVAQSCENNDICIGSLSQILSATFIQNCDDL
jgi:hypothetical protein